MTITEEQFTYLMRCFQLLSHLPSFSPNGISKAKQARYKKALVIGAGSGRDIASAVLLTEKLRKQGVQVDLAGFLTPWAVHEFAGKLERPINTLDGSPTRKFLANKREQSIPFFEPELFKLNTELGLGLEEIHLFSLHYGTLGLLDAIQRLVRTKEYDLILAVDVGGDILATREDCRYIYTPIVDLTCLNILTWLDTSADLVLSVIAPGSDGEIPSRRLAEIVAELRVKGILLGGEGIFNTSQEFSAFFGVNSEINSRTRLHSQTFDSIVKIVNSDHNLTETYKRRNKDEEFQVELIKGFADRIFHFDLREVARRLGFSLPSDCLSVLLLARIFQALGCAGTEVDSFHVPVCIIDGDYNITALI